AYADSDIENRLRARLLGDLSFSGHDTAYASHNTHAFAAKFPPQLPRAFIEELTDAGEVVLDPMAGSGTALVEAAMAGRIGIGIDLDPLAVAICSAKTNFLDPEAVALLGEGVSDYARLILANEGPGYHEKSLSGFDDESRKFIQYWFEAGTICELAALREAIEKLVEHPYRRLFDVVFSSIIITKSGGVSLARDLAHTRPHKVTDKRIKNAVDVFREKLEKVNRALVSAADWPGTAHVLRSDSRSLPLGNETADLIVTSPPYANAIDYMRAHKFSLVWLGHAVGTLSKMRRTYIGAELPLEDGGAMGSETYQRVMKDLLDRDARRARVIVRYFHDMLIVLGEIYRVSRKGRSAIVVVGSSTVRGIEIPTALILAELGERMGFRLVGVKDRPIDRNRRLMPISRASDKMGIEARMHGEQVIAFTKPG
ncbi:MAG: DNA methyltransferase, partial [Dehalococcoidia bacterium]